MTKLFAIIGNPVMHSRSPQTHNAGFEAISLDAHYIRVAAKSAEDALKTADEMGILGLNITSPFKEEIIPLLNRIDKNAKKIGAVNTIVKEGKDWIGYNTDYIGVVDSIEKNGIELKGKKAVVIGAGGAARAAVYGLISAGAEVVIVNRTLEKAEKIAEKLNCRAVPVEELEEELENAQILISCVDAKHNLVKKEMLHKDLVVLDAQYSSDSKLVLDAIERNCKIIDALEWLLYQAVPAFELFTGKKAIVNAMKYALYKDNKKKNNIALIGFMGSGKTITAKTMAEKNRKQILETDEEIEKNAGMKISEIFETMGETRFRELESRILKEMEIENNIISCGGGIVISRNNVALLRKNCTVIWLWTAIDEIIKRTKGNSERPLLKGNKKRTIEKLLGERIENYAKASDLVIDTNGKNPEEIAERILNEVNS